ncbi:MAG: CDP-glycerol glycerophosphotransferase family protein [Xanthomonadales bacterium]|nr:CDP-glycerol glycerophosphotransferase family protein [Xanthomonadales bacterium]
MSFLAGWKAWKRFRKLPREWRKLVFYSETGQDWHHFSGLIAELNSRLQHKVCYVTSDQNDPGLNYQHPNYQGIWLPEGFFLTVFFQMSQSDVFVLTMMDLNNLQLKRSVHPVHYVYLFHSMGSTHMVDHANSFDHYDSLFCTGPHQVKEIRRREELQGLPAKHLFDYGHPRLEQILHEGREFRLDAGMHAGNCTAENRQPIVLIAPTWGDTSIFNVCGEELIETLLGANFQVIMRPHYQSNRLTPDVIESTRKRFEANPDFEYIAQMGETQSLFRSDVLISDWSAMALEYSLGLEKPVLFIDVPRRIRNPDWQEWGIEPMESAIRSQVGEIVALDELERAPEKILHLLSCRADFTNRMRALREQMVFRMGHSVADGANELARIAERQCELRQSRGTRHA